MSTDATTATATILVTDTVASTALRSAIGEEQADALRRAHDAALSEAIDNAGGRVVKGTGDGLLATFDSATDALSAAVAVQRAAGETGRESGQEISVRVGLAAGDVSFEDGDCFGTPVIEAARLCDRAEPRQILCTTLVTLLAGGRGGHDLIDLGDRTLKGLDRPVGVHAVTWAPEPGAGRITTPFVGRGQERRRLDDHLAAARAGAGGVVLVTGEPGMGKTRLLEEFGSGLEDATVLRGVCRESVTIAYEPFAEAIVEWARGVADPASATADLGPLLVRLAPTLTDEIGAVDAAPPIDPEAEAVRVHDAFVRFVDRLAQSAPVVLVLDDLHWADHGSIQLLRALGRVVRSCPVLVVCAYRETDLDRSRPLGEALPELHREAEPTRIALDGLDRDEVGRMVTILARQEVPDGLVDALDAETQGNPFFVREVLLHLVEEGRLRHEDGRWVGDGVDQLDIPEGVRQVVGRRLSRLSTQANDLLAVGALFDGAFPLQVAGPLAGLDEAEALDAVDAALDAQVIEPSSRLDSYDFTHALFRHVLEEELSPSRQVRLHRAIGEALAEGAGREPDLALATAIARQFHASSVLPGAEAGLPHALAAAGAAERAAAHGDAVTALEMVLELSPDGDDEMEWREHLTRERILAHAPAEEVLRDAERLRDLLVDQDPEHASDRLADLARASESSDMATAWEIGDLAWAARAAERHDNTWVQLRAYQIARAEHDDPDNPGIPLDSPERRELNEVVRREGLKPRGLWTCQPRDREEARRWAADDGSGVPGALDRGLYLVFMSGDLVEGERCLREARDQAAASGNLGSELFAISALMRLTFSYGRFEECDRLRAEGAALADRVVPTSNPAMQYLGATLMTSIMAGDLDVAPIEESFADAAGADQSWAAASIASGGAMIAGHQGDRDRVRAITDPLMPAISRAIGGAANYPFIIGNICAARFLVDDRSDIDLLEQNLRDKVIEPGFDYLEASPATAMACLATVREDRDAAEEWFGRADRGRREAGRWMSLLLALEYEAIAWFRLGDEARFVDAVDRMRRLDVADRVGLASPTLEREIQALRTAGL